jgi:hypothetical protein
LSQPVTRIYHAYFKLKLITFANSCAADQDFVVEKKDVTRLEEKGIPTTQYAQRQMYQ